LKHSIAQEVLNGHHPFQFLIQVPKQVASSGHQTIRVRCVSFVRDCCFEFV